MARVLVTRPQPGAAHTARRLAELGYRPIELPLTQTVALTVAPISTGRPVDAVAVTSANALRHASKDVLAGLIGKPCFAVGERTAAMARERGFETVTAAGGDANALATLVGAHLRPGSAIAYLSGKIRLSDFEARMAAAGIGLVTLETYDTQAIGYTPRDLADIVGTEPIEAVLLYSANAAERFSNLPWPEGFEDRIARAACICMSQRVADRLAPGAAARILVAPEPSEPALLGLLSDAIGRP